MMLSFSKYSGSGNDFILIDNREDLFPKDPELVKRLCKRQIGIGADGIILLEASEIADFKMFLYNSDGSEPEMCGNGARCFVKYLDSLGVTESSYSVEVAGRVLTFNNSGEKAYIDMGRPKELALDIELSFEDKVWQLHHINTGVPHVVVFVDSLDCIDIVKLGSYFRFHDTFAPRGANVNFVQVLEDQLKIRTYERGVEGETLACGTGSTASALIAAIKYHLPSPIKVEVASKEVLDISFDIDGLSFSNVFMGGAARESFQGVFPVKNFASKDALLNL